MKYLAILKDSWVEALDRKSLYVMFAFSALIFLLLGSISYSEMDASAAIQDITQRFKYVSLPRMHGMEDFNADFKVEELRALGADAGPFEGGYAFRVSVSPVKAFHKTVRYWDAVHRGLVRKPGDKAKDLDVEAPEDLEIKFFKERYFDHAMSRREVGRVASDGDRRVFDVKVKAASKSTLDGAYRIHFFFGAWSTKPPMSLATWIYVMQELVSRVLSGFFGILVALILTASSVPAMLQKGFVDVLISKPIHRPVLLAYKYVGGLTYATLTGSVFLGGSWLILSARSGVWNLGYLATLSTLILFFGVLYSIGVLAAVLTRSTIAAAIAPAGAWFLGWLVNWLKNDVLALLSDAPEWLDRGLGAASWFLPRAGDINRVNDWFIWKGSGGGDTFEMIGAKPVDWMPILGSSFLFIAVMLSLACWLFSRKDY